QQAAVGCPLRLGGPFAEYTLQIPENFVSGAGVHGHEVPKLINYATQMQEARCNGEHHAKTGQQTSIRSNPTQEPPYRVLIDLYERGLDQAGKRIASLRCPSVEPSCDHPFLLAGVECGLELKHESAFAHSPIRIDPYREGRRISRSQDQVYKTCHF